MINVDRWSLIIGKG